MENQNQNIAKSKTTLKILDFMDKLQKVKMNTEKNGDELMTIEEAVWYIEAALNYTNAEHPIEANRQPEFKKLTLDLSLIDNKVTLEDVLALFEDFDAEINSDPNQIFRAADIEYNFENGNSSLSLTAILLAPGAPEYSVSSGPPVEDWIVEQKDYIQDKVNSNFGFDFSGEIPETGPAGYFTSISTFEYGLWYLENDYWYDYLLNPTYDVNGDMMNMFYLPLQSSSSGMPEYYDMSEDELNYFIFTGLPAAIDICHDENLLFLSGEANEFVYVDGMPSEAVDNGFFGRYGSVNPQFAYGEYHNE